MMEMLKKKWYHVAKGDKNMKAEILCVGTELLLGDIHVIYISEDLRDKIVGVLKILVRSSAGYIAVFCDSARGKAGYSVSVYFFKSGKDKLFFCVIHVIIPDFLLFSSIRWFMSIASVNY